MRGLIWSARALADLDRLRDFLIDFDLPTARRAMQAIDDGTEILRERPQIGRPVPDLPRDYREWSIRFGRGGYVVRYRIEAADSVIVAVRHMREAGFEAE